MNFDLKNTDIYLAIKRERFLLFRFARFFKNLFLILFFISLLLIGFSFFNFTSGYSAAKMLVLFLSLYLIFWNINLFTNLKIKKPEIFSNIADAASSPENYNLASFLDFDTARIVLDAISFCKKKKIAINSTALFYSAVKFNKDINLICFRLGLNPKKLLVDIKNYLEKTEKLNVVEDGEVFSDDFQRTIKSAAKVSAIGKDNFIGENEILVALAQEDEFFKKSLTEFDLKSEDVENLILWLESAEYLMSQNKKFWTYENLLRKGSLGKDFSTGYTITLDILLIGEKLSQSGSTER